MPDNPQAEQERAEFDKRQAAHLYKFSFIAGLLGLSPDAPLEDFQTAIRNLRGTTVTR